MEQKSNRSQQRDGLGSSSIMRLRKEDLDKKSNISAGAYYGAADTVLYLREIDRSFFSYKASEL
jgi:hypothetical protein